MLTAQVGWSVPFSVTPLNSLQHLQKAAETISAGKNVDETQGLSSCGTVRCDGRQTDASRTENPESCCKIFSSPSWCTAGRSSGILTMVVMSQYCWPRRCTFISPKADDQAAVTQGNGSWGRELVLNKRHVG